MKGGANVRRDGHVRAGHDRTNHAWMKGGATERRTAGADAPGHEDHAASMKGGANEHRDIGDMPSACPGIGPR
ncbi:hypothetical protein [Planotetraspora phitsanulokensis]|uniref:hypothetical protein n=1 Tax=Planotetraspora phitsanulokensis TaxID=575192 RepID=UPI00194EFD31|nr:hypothetical protein [Planotetraspora phitsanulokensis]